MAHSIFGTAQTINSANYVYFLALEEVRKLKNVTAIDVFIKELLHLHRGQGMDLFWRDTLTCPTEDDYIEMVGNKTGGLFRLAIELMQAESPTNMCVKLPPSLPISVPCLRFWVLKINTNIVPQRLYPSGQSPRCHIPNLRRLFESIPLDISTEQGPLRRSHGREILLSYNPQHTNTTRQFPAHQYIEREAHRRRGETLCRQVHEEHRKLRIYPRGCFTALRQSIAHN